MPKKATPLRIASPEGFPNIGLSLCPGKIDPRAMTGPVARDIYEDISVIKTWGASLEQFYFNFPTHTHMKRTNLERLQV